jgi:hypothetical protein
VAELRASRALARDLIMDTAPDPTISTAIAATDPTKPAVAARIKLQSEGFAIDHPDLELGEQLMADTLGVADRDAMYGLLRQPVRAPNSSPQPVTPRSGHAGGADGFGSRDGVRNVTQHASVVVKEKGSAAAGRRASKAAGSGESAMLLMSNGKHRHERSRRRYRSDAGEPAVRRQNAFRRRVPFAGD